MQFGFIGIGQMGGGLARNLIRAKKNVWVFDLNPEAVKTTLAAGTTGRAAAKIEELAGADVVFTSLPLPQHLESVMLGPKGLLGLMKPGATYIDVSTIDPGTARKLSDAAEAKGIDFLECPLGKTPAQAEKAEEPIFAGGKKAVYEKMLDTLQIIGHRPGVLQDRPDRAAFRRQHGHRRPGASDHHWPQRHLRGS
jgi:3-hydroxyisobutyrate dehydrogenase-like beta-hydroxyacid dehydrogenase